LWGRKVAVAAPVRVPVRSVMVLPEVETQEYARIAQAIGWNSNAVFELKVRNFLDREGIDIYPYDKVETYLDDQFGHWSEWCNYGRKWLWRPLRDVDFGLHLSRDLEERNGSILSHQTDSYDGAIPFPVLVTVEKLATQFPDLKFYVSDVPNQKDRPQDDPFVGIAARGMQLLVIERWDEPSFRM
jgi:hypothetical protein